MGSLRFPTEQGHHCPPPQASSTERRIKGRRIRRFLCCRGQTGKVSGNGSHVSLHVRQMLVPDCRLCKSISHAKYAGLLLSARIHASPEVSAVSLNFLGFWTGTKRHSGIRQDCVMRQVRLRSPCAQGARGEFSADHRQAEYHLCRSIMDIA